MAGNFQHNKRVRVDDNQGDGSDMPKQEAHHGLPIA
jgi:hypothetical protein